MKEVIKMFEIPILYIVFNRLDTVRQTFLQIKKQCPKDLYIAADGPRIERKGETEKCKVVRDWILSQIDWNCNIHVLFRENNLGCKYGVSGAIKWFFDNVDFGIVLEDDILATDSFFRFCEKMLIAYKDRRNIGFISGCCFSSELCSNKKYRDYFLSTIPGVWGWASWKRAITDYSPDNATLLKKRYSKNIVLDKNAAKALLINSKLAALGEIDTWDYQMVDFMITKGQYTIYPCVNLVRNIGFHADSTHTSNSPHWYTDISYEYDIQLRKRLYINKKYSRALEKEFYTPSFVCRILKMCVRKIKNSIYSKFSFFDELYRSCIRWLDGATGQCLRYRYYKKRLRHLGRNVIIDTGVFFTGTRYISIGDNTHIDKNCILVGAPSSLDLSYRYVKERQNINYTGKKGEISIGNECHISQNTMLYGYGGIYIGNNSVLSAGTKVYSLTSMAYNPYDKTEIVSIVPYDGKSPTLIGGVVLGNNVWCGIDCIISPGVTLGDNTFVKSQSIVNSSFKDNSYAGGSPAVYIRKRYDFN